MKDTVDQAQVAHIAALAKLCLNDDEFLAMQRDLMAMLALCSTMQPGDDVTVGKVCGMEALRADETHPGLSREALLACAPCSADGMVRIPGALLEEGA